MAACSWSSASLRRSLCITGFGKPFEQGAQRADFVRREQIERALSDAPEVLGPRSSEGSRAGPRQGCEGGSTVNRTRTTFNQTVPGHFGDDS